jgi:hypothetical protein
VRFWGYQIVYTIRINGEDVVRLTLSVRLLLVRANVFPSSPILVTLMKEALSSSVTSQKTQFFFLIIVSRSGCLPFPQNRFYSIPLYSILSHYCI